MTEGINGMATCEVCFRRCRLAEGETGACRARICRDGQVQPAFYGRLSSLALDPIEKKPLARFYPGSMILSAGSLGCNLHCAFCQNDEIAQATDGGRFRAQTEEVSPMKLVEVAEYYRRKAISGLRSPTMSPWSDTNTSGTQRSLLMKKA